MSASRPGRLLSPARAVVLAAMALGAAAIVLAAHGSYFTTDDHVFFAQDAETSFGLRFLTEPIYDHFSPWHRLNDHIVTSLTHQGWWLALSLSLAWYAAVVTAFALLVRELVGRHPAGLAACILFAVSPVFVRTGQWWALGAQQLPQLCFSLLSVWSALRWVQSRRRRWLAIAIATFALALCGFVKALVVPLFLVLVIYAAPGRWRGLRDAARAAWARDRALWIGLAAVAAGYLAVISDDRYYRYARHEPGVGAAVWGKYLVAGWGEGVVPLTFGGTVGRELGPGNWLVILAAQAALIGVIVLTARRRPRAALTWGVAVVVTLATLVASAGARLSHGVEFVALEPRYNAEGAIALLLAGAVTAAAAWPRPRAQSVHWLAAAGAAVLVGAFVVDADRRLERSFDGPRNRAYFETFQRTLDRQRAEGRSPSLLDGATPDFVVPAAITNANLLSRVLPLHVPGLKVGAPGAWPAAVDDRGRVRPVALRTEVAGTPAALTTRGRLRPPSPSGHAVCVGARGRPELALDVGRTGEVEHVLELGLAAGTGEVRATVVADAGGAQRVRGFPLPATVTTPLRVPAGRRGHRLIFGVGRLRSLVIRPDPGTRLCIRALAVSDFPLPPG